MLGSLCVTRRVLLLVMAVCATACGFTSSPVTPAGTTWRLSGTINIVSGGRLAGPIPGARLTVQDGTNKGAQVTSDSSGRSPLPTSRGGASRCSLRRAASSAQLLLSRCPVISMSTSGSAGPARRHDADFGERQQRRWIAGPERLGEKRVNSGRDPRPAPALRAHRSMNRLQEP